MQHESAEWPNGSSATSAPDSHACCGLSRHRELIESLSRQIKAMERLAELLPQVIAQNQVFLRLLTDRAENDDEPTLYLDGSPR